MLADQSSKSSGYRNNLSVLSTAALIGRAAGGRIMLTDTGRGLAVPPPGTPTNADLQHSIYAQLSMPQAALLRVLVARYPEPVNRDDLAAAAGVSPASSGFRNNLSVLSVLELVERPDGATVRALPILFPHG